MAIGQVIRKYRKEAKLTQEEMARRLGVTAPAVNKWESGSTQPDIGLLAPISRLLGITTDTLLSFSEELSDEEIQVSIESIVATLDEKGFAEAFAESKRMIEQYPNSIKLIWNVLNVPIAKAEKSKKFNYEPYIEDIKRWYKRCIESDNEEYRIPALRRTVFYCLKNKKYEEALYYAAMLPGDRTERKWMEDDALEKLGNMSDAGRVFGELIFASYNRTMAFFDSLRTLYIKDDNPLASDILADALSKVALSREMSRYSVALIGLYKVAQSKDVEKTERLMRGILDCADDSDEYKTSKLYSHIEFKNIDPGFRQILKKNLSEAFTENCFSYMSGNTFWEGLKEA